MDSRRSSFISQLDFDFGLRFEVELDTEAPTATFFLRQESRVTLEEARQAGREFVQVVTRVDKALETLRKELQEMRDQDLQLLKQLIQTGETIRRMSQSRDFRDSTLTLDSSRDITASFEDLSSGTLPSWYGGRERHLGTGFNSVPLIRRQSEPQMCMLDRSEVGTRERRPSGSSADAWSIGTLGSSEDNLDILASVEDLINTSSSSITLTLTTNKIEESQDADTTSLSAPEAVLRPKSHSVVASTFLTRSNNLSGGHSAYSDILNRNIRLWKCRNAHAQNRRSQEAVLEEEM